MAEKRRIEQGSGTRQPEDELDEDRSEAFGEWLKGTYSRYWYGLACLMVDIFVPIEVANRFQSPLLPIVLIILLVGLIGAEFIIYRRIWKAEEEDEEEEP
jgi:hypothetical protein